MLLCTDKGNKQKIRKRKDIKPMDQIESLEYMISECDAEALKALEMKKSRLSKAFTRPAYTGTKAAVKPIKRPE